MLGRWLAPGAILLLTGCGWITGTTVGTVGGSSSESDGGPGNAAPSVGAFSLESPRTSPANVAFTLIDSEADPVDVRLYFALDDATRRPLMLTAGEGGLTGLETSRGGIQHGRRWDFASQLGPGFREAVTLEIEVVPEGGQGPVVQTRVVSLGNDAPEITDVVFPPGEIVGSVAIDLLVSDSSSDVVDVRLEYDVLGDDPDRGFRVATPVGQTSTQVVAVPEGTPFTYVWDVVADEGFAEHDLVVRFTPNDGDVDGPSPEFALRIDNNSEPIALLKAANFILNPDRTRGIPLGFEVFDGDVDSGEPADDVLLVFQWRYAEESFPPLPSDPAEMEAILRDPVRREELRIATEKPTVFRGLPQRATHLPGNDSAVRLPELASTAAGLLSVDSITGERTLRGELEILRRSMVPVDAALPSGLLENPVGALPASKTTALVLDAPGVGGWRIREIDPASGEVLSSPIADPAAGTATAWVREAPGSSSLLIASHTSGLWRVQRGDDATGVVTELITADGSTELGPIRGIAALGTHAALITLESSLLRLDYLPGELPRISEIFSPTSLRGPLQKPWGIVVDPLDSGRVYIAENEADRILSLHLETEVTCEITASGVGLPKPEMIALERGGARLLVITDNDPGDGLHELRGLDVREARDLDLDGTGDSEVFEILPSTTAPGLPGRVASVAAGEDGLRLLVLPDSQALWVGGGVEQVRQIKGYDRNTQTATVSRPFEPSFQGAELPRRWRMSRRLPLKSSAAPTGKTGTFVWDSSEAIAGGEVTLRVTAFDTERGTENSTERGKPIFPRFGGQVRVVDEGTTERVNLIRARDIDRDGDLDIVAVGEDLDTRNLLVSSFLQISPGQFALSWTAQLPEPINAISLALGDLDQDGDLDLAFPVDDPSNVQIYWQTAPGEFSSGPLLGASPILTHVLAADFDQDGDVDLLTIYREDEETGTIIYSQTSPGAFTAGPRIDTGGLPAATGDLDGDGDLDLLSAQLTVYFQSAPGVFTLGPTIEDLGSRFPTLGDIDGDGNLDIAVGLLDENFLPASVGVYCQVRPGEFELGPVITEELVGGNLNSFTFGDVDGDGDLDLVVTKGRGHSIAIAYQESPGEFSVGPRFGPGNQTGSPQLGDMDGDGDVDILTANFSSDDISIFFQTDPEEFEPGPLLGDDTILEGPVNVEAGDFDGDGDLDLVATSQIDQVVKLIFQTAPGEFEFGPELETQDVFHVDRADLDGDGDLDLLIPERVPGTVTIAWQTSPGSFAPGTVLGGPGITDSAWNVATGDLDGDGDLDFVSANTSFIPEAGNNLTLFFQMSPGEFSPGPVLGDIDTTQGPSDVQLGDLDGDGDLDIITSNSSGNNVTIFFQESPGQFTLGPILGDMSFNHRPSAIAIEDLDGDGDLDFVVANTVDFFAPNHFVTFFQTQPGEFVQGQSLGDPADWLPTNVIAADVDSDGDIDIIGNYGFATKVIVYHQTRPGVFSVGQEVPLPGAFDLPYGLEVADLDQDGDVDIVSANIGASNLAIFFGGH